MAPIPPNIKKAGIDKRAVFSGAMGALAMCFLLFMIYAFAKIISNDLYQKGYDACLYGSAISKVDK